MPDWGAGAFGVDEVHGRYLKIVEVSSLDYRVANQFQRNGTTQAVALAPGAYAAYNPSVPDLVSYYEGPSYGDCAARNFWFPESGGACWSGVR